MLELARFLVRLLLELRLGSPLRFISAREILKKTQSTFLIGLLDQAFPRLQESAVVVVVRSFFSPVCLTCTRNASHMLPVFHFFSASLDVCSNHFAFLPPASTFGFLAAPSTDIVHCSEICEIHTRASVMSWSVEAGYRRWLLLSPLAAGCSSHSTVQEHL